MDLHGMKTALLIGLALIVIALLGLKTASGYGPVAAFMLLLGMGGGAIVVGANGMPPHIHISSLSVPGIFNLLNLFFGLGGLVTPLIAARMFQNNSARLLFFASALVAATLAFHAATAMPAPSGQVAFQVGDVGSLLGNTQLLMLALLLFVYVACEVGVWNWLARHLISVGVPESKALTVLSLGFALGLLLGRVAVSPVLSSVTPERVLLGAAVLMTITTFAMLQSANPNTAWLLVFLAGAAMAPVFPTTLAVVGSKFPSMAATATGIAVTAGWLGLVVSSPIIGAIAGDDPKRLKTALLVLPAMSAVMMLVSLAL
jgi:fucose permease